MRRFSKHSMATIRVSDQEQEVSNNSPVQLACDELGIVFGCRNGMCRTCESEVLEGMENLSPPNEKERMHGLSPTHRLMCQAEIKNGTVVIKSNS